MSAKIRDSLIAAGLFLVGCGGGEPRALSATQPPPCIRWSTEARYRPYGYDHVVHIHNTCSLVADCTVTTDVNPHPERASVPPQSKAEVITWVGSPSRVFNASVQCFLRAGR